MGWKDFFSKKNKHQEAISVEDEPQELPMIKDPNDPEEYEKFESSYQEEDFEDKVLSLAKSSGHAILEEAFKLYHLKGKASAFQLPIILGALGYFILPFDMIPDVIPLLGFSDDLVAIAAVMKSLDTIYRDNKNEIDKAVANSIRNLSAKFGGHEEE